MHRLEAISEYEKDPLGRETGKRLAEPLGSPGQGKDQLANLRI